LLALLAPQLSALASALQVLTQLGGEPHQDGVPEEQKEAQREKPERGVDHHSS
jgi:hypothetical protein